MKPRTVCFCQPIFSIISASVAPFLRCSMATTLAALGALAAFFAVVAFLGAAAFGLPPLALFWLLGAPFLALAPFFGEAFSGATFAPGSATAAAWSLVSAFSVLIFV